MIYFRKCLAFVISIIILNVATGQDTLHWRSGHKLSWQDFQARPDTTLGYEALTFSGIDCKYTFTDTAFVFDINCFFEKKKSWRMPWADSIALRHEQLHFDISEVFARKLKQELSKLRPSRSNVKTEVNSLVKKIFQQKDLMQDSYDQETDFGRIAENQKKWQNKIASLLQQNNKKQARN